MSIKVSSELSVPSAITKLATITAIAVVIGLVAGALTTWKIAPLLAWDSGVIIFVATTWRRVLKFSPGLVKQHALREDPSRVVSEVILLAASVASIAAVGLLLVAAKDTDGVALFGLTFLGVVSVVASWLMVHTVYALKYAEIYYSKPQGGVDFGDTQEPVYADFAYLAFTLGMTYQVSDTTLGTKEFRSAALKHALLSFLIGTVIIATTINLVAGLGK